MWEWQKWCKLCAKQETEQCPVDFESYTKFAFIIQKYFAVAVSFGTIKYKQTRRESKFDLKKKKTQLLVFSYPIAM